MAMLKSTIRDSIPTRTAKTVEIVSQSFAAKKISSSFIRSGMLPSSKSEVRLETPLVVDPKLDGVFALGFSNAEAEMDTT